MLSDIPLDRSSPDGPNRSSRAISSYGKKNIVAGLLFLAGFMAYGFVLIYLRDLAPGKEAWIAQYSSGAHFESKLAHVHGNLFAFINVMIGYLLLRLPVPGDSASWISWLGLTGMLMPIGILTELLFGLPPVLVLAGGVAMVLSVGWLGMAIARLQLAAGPQAFR